MRLQRQLANGMWTDVEADRVDYFVDRVVERGIFNFKERRLEAINRDEVVRRLESGVRVQYDSDWYANLRDADAVKPRKRTEQPQVRCQCGHTVAENLVMSTSRGTSCPDCYDRMSE